MLAASSGARRGELLALRWSDIDLDRGRLSIERGIVRVGEDIIEQGTKTHQSRRISLDAGTVAALRAHEVLMIERAQAASSVITSQSFVFSHSVDCSSPWHPDSTSRAFRRICQQAGVQDVRLHDLRHYVATRSWPLGSMSVPSPAGWDIEIQARPSTCTRISSQKLIKKLRRLSDESSRMPTVQHPVSCSARILLVWLPANRGNVCSNSGGCLVSPGSTGGGRCWRFGQRIDAGRERACKSRSRRVREVAEHQLLHRVD